MQGYNLIAVFDMENSRVLLCKRKKNPYKDLYNFVGGKIEPGEEHLSAAYRELFEETTISEQDIKLVHIMDYTYYFEPCFIEVYAGVLRHSVSVVGEENELEWFSIDTNFGDNRVFAGNGNVAHIIKLSLESLNLLNV